MAQRVPPKQFTDLQQVAGKVLADLLKSQPKAMTAATAETPPAGDTHLDAVVIDGGSSGAMAPKFRTTRSLHTLTATRFAGAATQDRPALGEKQRIRTQRVILPEPAVRTAHGGRVDPAQFAARVQSDIGEAHAIVRSLSDHWAFDHQTQTLSNVQVGRLNEIVKELRAIAKYFARCDAQGDFDYINDAIGRITNGYDGALHLAMVQMTVQGYAVHRFHGLE